jgi:hypothetical protein
MDRSTSHFGRSAPGALVAQALAACGLALAAVFSPVVAQQPDARDELRVARLVKDLGDAEFSTRASAFEQLAKTGAAGRAALEQAAADPDPEVRLRARQLLSRLQLEDLWAPGRVRLRAKGQPAAKILQDLAAQTGNHVHIGDPYGNFAAAPLDVDYNCSYWEAVDDVCRRTGNRARPHYDMHTPGIVVSAGEPGSFPRAYAGPVRAQITSARRLFIEELSYEEHKAELTHSFHVNLQFTWEDRFRIVGYATQPELVEAVTDNGAIVSSAQPAGGGWNATSRGLRQVTASLKLNPVPISARSFEVFAVRWGLIAVGEPAVLEIADVTPQVDRTQDDVAVRIESLEKQAAGKYALAINVLRDLAMPDPLEVVYQEYEVELVDEQGRAFRVQNQSPAMTDRGVQIKAVFIGESPASEPVRLKLHYPRIRARRDVQLVFRNVPLPVDRPE